MQDKNFKKLKEKLPEIQKNILLKDYTTFKIGGRAKYFFIAKTEEDLIKAVRWAIKCQLPLFVLGGGSNVLISDKKFEGLVIKIESRFQSEKIENFKVIAKAGVSLAKLVSVSAEERLAGLEWAAGIPGTVGGAIYGNAGAFGKSMRDVVREVKVLDKEDLQFKIYRLSNCKFNYRNSIFKRSNNLIILSAILQLSKGNKKEVQNKIKWYLKRKKETQPLNYPSAGSIFKNPGKFSAGELGEEDKSSSSSFTAAQLIEKCGLRGKKIGGAQISEKHANFIINLGLARAKDVKKLINLTKQKVKNKFKIDLEEEIELL